MDIICLASERFVWPCGVFKFISASRKTLLLINPLPVENYKVVLNTNQHFTFVLDV